MRHGCTGRSRHSGPGSPRSASRYRPGCTSQSDQVWQKVRAALLTAGQLDGPLMSQPYCLRHAGVTRAAQRGRGRGHRRGVGRALGGGPAPHLPSLGRGPGRGPDRTDGRPTEAVVMGTHRGQNSASSDIGWRHVAPAGPARFASSQVRGRLVLVMKSAPSRIRTCAHGSGGRLSALANLGDLPAWIRSLTPGRSRSFRVYSGSWKLPSDRPYVAGNGPERHRQSRRKALGGPPTGRRPTPG